MNEDEQNFSSENPEKKRQERIEMDARQLERIVEQLGFEEPDEMRQTRSEIKSVPGPEFDRWYDMADNLREQIRNDEEDRKRLLHDLSILVLKASITLRLGNWDENDEDRCDAREYARIYGLADEIIEQI